MAEYADSLSKTKQAKATETARENRRLKRDAEAKAAAAQKAETARETRRLYRDKKTTKKN